MREPMPRYTSPTLLAYPEGTMIRLACSRCDRRGQYRREGLIAKYGTEMTLPDLRHLLAGGCPLVGHRSTPCGIYYVDLS
jgi:hypothetical protein